MCLLLTAHATLAFDLFDYQGFPDRLFLLPFLAIIDGIAVGAVIDRAIAMLLRRSAVKTAAGSDRRLAGMETAAVVLAALLLLARLEGPDPAVDKLAAQREAALVAEMVRQEKTVYAIGPLHLLAMNRMSNFNRYGFFPLRVASYLNARIRAEGPLVPLADGKLPDVVLQSRKDFRGNRHWMRRYFVSQPIPVLARQGIRVWMRREGVALQPHARPF